MLNNEQKKRIAETLQERKQNLTCPMCQNKNFIMADGYFNNNMQTDFGSISIGGPAIPTIGIICDNCGFVSQHAIGVLGLLPKENLNRDEPSK
jgi:rubredoxin